jgi:hypothetical protein
MYLRAQVHSCSSSGGADSAKRAVQQDVYSFCTALAAGYTAYVSTAPTFWRIRKMSMMHLAVTLVHMLVVLQCVCVSSTAQLIDQHESHTTTS